MSVTDSDPPHHHHEEHGHGHSHEINAFEFGRIVFVGLIAAAVRFQLWEPWPAFSILGLAGILIGGYPIFKEALHDIVSRRMTMELSMTIALLAALIIGEVFTTLVIIFFVLVAEVLEGLTVGRGRHAIGDLVAMLPREVTIRSNGAETSVAVEDLRIGAVVLVRPGARIPVDGEVQTGHSFVDESAITGESLPVEKVPGALVFAGTINQAGLLEVRTGAVGHNTTFGRIIEAVERAESTRAPVQKIADRFAGYLVIVALGAAAITFLVTRDARSTISVIIVAGACGIAAGTPLAILGAIGRSARFGSIIKGGIHLETLGSVDTVVLDKTGTLTFGDPEIETLLPEPGVDDRQLLATAATAERSSEHPLARAVLKRAAAEGFGVAPADCFQYTPGRGIVCVSAGDEIAVGSKLLLEERGIALPLGGGESELSEIYVARAGRFLGRIRIADVIRPEAGKAISALKALGIKTILLTGDREAIARSVSEKLRVDEVEAELMPEDKLVRIERLLASGRTVAMIGDGVNDAPALARSSVGVAMGSGTDVARECADIMLIGNDLLKFVETVRVARRCLGIIRANFVGTLVVDAAGMALAAVGMLNPLLAAFIHVSSELVFILNSARLLPATSR